LDKKRYRHLPRIQVVGCQIPKFVWLQCSSAISNIFCSIGYVKTKINKKSLLSHLLRIFFVGFIHIYTLHLTTFFKKKFKKTWKNKKKVIKRKNVTWIKKRKKTFITSMELSTSPRCGQNVLHVACIGDVSRVSGDKDFNNSFIFAFSDELRRMDTCRRFISPHICCRTEELLKSDHVCHGYRKNRSGLFLSGTRCSKHNTYVHMFTIVAHFR